jgi:hypothetical protein
VIGEECCRQNSISHGAAWAARGFEAVAPDMGVRLSGAQSPPEDEPLFVRPSLPTLAAIWRSVCWCIALEYEVTVVRGSSGGDIVVV